MKKRQEGSAMILVMCVMVVIVALVMSLLLSASVLIMNANRSNQKEQCRIAAISMSEVLCDEILLNGNYTTAPSAEGQAGTSSELANKLHTVFSSAWLQYHSDAGTVQQIQIEARGIYRYEMKNENMPLTETKVEMYWTQAEELDRNPEDTIQELIEKFEDVTLYVKVTCIVGEEASTIISAYKPYTDSTEIPDKEDFSWKWAFDGPVWEGSED